MSARTVKSLAKGDTVIRLLKGLERCSHCGDDHELPDNLTDYTVTIEDTAKDTEVSVTFPHFTDANQAFGMAWSQAQGEDDDLAALLGVSDAEVNTY